MKAHIDNVVQLDAKGATFIVRIPITDVDTATMTPQNLATEMGYQVGECLREEFKRHWVRVDLIQGGKKYSR